MRWSWATASDGGGEARAATAARVRGEADLFKTRPEARIRARAPARLADAAAPRSKKAGAKLEPGKGVVWPVSGNGCTIAGKEGCRCCSYRYSRRTGCGTRSFGP